MSKKPEIKIQTLNNQLQTIDSLGYTRLPQDTKNQNRNNYLDSCSISGVVDTPGYTSPTITLYYMGLNKDVYSDMVNLNMIDSNFNEQSAKTYNFKQTGNLQWNINSDGGIVIPVDGTYIINLFGMFMSQYDDPTYTRLGLDTCIITGVVITSEGQMTFTTRGDKNSIIPMTLESNKTSDLKKGDSLYISVGHAWSGTSIPVIGNFVITKIS